MGQCKDRYQVLSCSVSTFAINHLSSKNVPSTSFADDSNGRKTFAIEFQFNVCKNDVESLLREIADWMNWKFMKINPEKTEILLLYPKAVEDKIVIQGTMVDGQCIRYSKVVKNVMTVFDFYFYTDFCFGGVRNFLKRVFFQKSTHKELKRHLSNHTFLFIIIQCLFGLLARNGINSFVGHDWISQKFT